jgi:N-succinyldiaminopimelate aminotransferase
VNPLFEAIQTSVFERMSALAIKHGAVNLGQGFPDFGWPVEILDAAARALKAESNQYPPSRGLAQLRGAIADHYRRHYGEGFGPDSVCVTSGATEALAACILAAVSPGDEVIVFTPAYDSYAPMIRRAGGTVREIALQPPEWRIERDRLESAIGPKTKAILFNNPHNPTGRLFGPGELQIVADAAIAHDLIVISDEVWEHLLLGREGSSFTPLAALPDMADRTLKIGSAGKIFSLTGWKVGWIAAAPKLAGIAARAHQFLTFSTAPNLQSAVAYGLAEGDSWIEPMRRRFTRARDRLSEGLQATGYVTLPCAATYFLLVDLRASGIQLDDETFAAAAVEQAGVAVVPLSAFAEDDPPRHLVRLCFAKRDETIDAGVSAMAKAKELLA